MCKAFNAKISAKPTALSFPFRFPYSQELYACLPSILSRDHYRTLLNVPPALPSRRATFHQLLMLCCFPSLLQLRFLLPETRARAEPPHSILDYCNAASNSHTKPVSHSHTPHTPAQMAQNGHVRPLRCTEIRDTRALIFFYHTRTRFSTHFSKGGFCFPSGRGPPQVGGTGRRRFALHMDTNGIG